MVVELDKQRRNMHAALEAVEDAFDTVFVAIAQDGIAQRKPLWRRIRDEGFPAKALREGSDGAFLAGDAGEVIADVLRYPLLTRCRASSPPDVVGVSLDLLLPFYLEAIPLPAVP